MPFSARALTWTGAAAATAVVIGSVIAAWPQIAEPWYVWRLQNGRDGDQTRAAEWLAAHGSAEGRYQLLRAAALGGGHPYYVFKNTVDWWKRSSVPSFAAALSSMGSNAHLAVPKRIELLRGADSRLAGDAALTLGAMGPAAESAIPRLRAAVDSAHGYVQNSAVLSLGLIGQKAAPVLRSLLEHSDPSIRDYASAVLASLTPPSDER